MGPHGVLGGKRVGQDAGQWTVVADRSGEHVRDAVRHQGVHDAALHEPLADGLFDRARAPNRVDRAHVQAMPAFHAFTGARHSQRRAEDGGLEIVHRDGVATEQRVAVTVVDEPDHVLPRARMHERGSDDPENLAAALLLFAQELRQHIVIHRPLAGHFRRHEAEFVGAVCAAQKTFDVDEDSLGAVFRRSHSHRVAVAHSARLGNDEIVGSGLHDHAIHARQARPPPPARQLHVRRQVRSRKKTVGKDPVGGCGREPCIGRTGQRRRGKVRWSILKARTTHRPVKIPEVKRLSQE